MARGGGKQIIESFKKRVNTYNLLSGALFAIAMGLLVTALLYRLGIFRPTPVLIVSIFLIALLVAVYTSPKTTEIELTRFLNRLNPGLEESCELILKPKTSLNLLERLQVERVELALQEIDQPQDLYRRLKFSLFVLLIAAIISLGIMVMPTFHTSNQENGTINSSNNYIKENVLPEIRKVRLLISPPAYTRRSSRSQSQFSLSAEDGALIKWALKTSVPAKSISLLFSDKTSVEMHPINGSSTEWEAGKTVISSGFYQVSLDGKLSDFYKLGVIKDQPPVINITSPKQYSTIDFGQVPRINLRIDLSDDYDIADAYVLATMASGQGEGIKFKEQKLLFGQGFGDRTYKLSKTINLAGLGMQPGDELYFYVQAQDRRKQDSRSDVYFVSIQDTAQLMSMEALASGVSLVPEYFRSQRQIIIDTEKLLRDKDSLSAEAFKTRSNNLGIDQKMLRLRYGKFLGEEEESDAGHDDGSADVPTSLGDASKIMDGYVHKHDQAEDATFFEPELKKQLKATLTEMWNSELRLRTYKPREALPYEYKALRLLKDLQQKSRVYVAKTSSKTQPLKMDRRLTGELDKIGNPVLKLTAPKGSSQADLLRKAIAALEGIKSGRRADNNSLVILQQANIILSQKAVREPSLYLEGLNALQKILSGKTKSPNAITAVEKALQRIIVPPQNLPGATEHSSSSLSGYYFRNLGRQ